MLPIQTSRIHFPEMHQQLSVEQLIGTHEPPQTGDQLAIRDTTNVIRPVHSLL